MNIAFLLRSIGDLFGSQEEMFRKVASYFVVFFHNFSAARLDASAAAVLIAEIRQSLTLDIGAAGCARPGAGYPPSAPAGAECARE